MCPKNHSNDADDSDDEEEEEQVADNGDDDEKQVWSRVQPTASYGVRRIPLFHKRSGQIMVSPKNEFTQTIVIDINTLVFLCVWCPDKN